MLGVCKLAMPNDYERMRYRGQSKLRRMRITAIVSYVISGIAGWVFLIALVIAVINKLA
jgi:hypothetical protein